MDKTKIDQAFAEFKARFPDFKSFNEPGTKFAELELNYKRELSEEFQKFGKQFLESDQTDLFDKFVEFFRNRKLVHFDNRPQNLTNFRDIMVLEQIVGAESESRTQFTFHIRDILQTADDDQRLKMAIDRFIDFLTEQGLQASFTKVWPTIVLFLMNPEKFIFIKPRLFDQILEKLGFEKIGSGVPLTSASYERLMNDLAALCNHIGATNFIQLHSFIWEIRDTRKVNEVKNISNHYLLKLFEQWRVDSKYDESRLKYKNLVDFIQPYRANELEVDDELIKQLWMSDTNWTVDLGQVALPEDIPQNGMNLLRSLTDNILFDPNSTTYKQAFKELKSLAKDDITELNVVSRLLIRRAFVAAHPERFVEILSNRYLKKLAKYLSSLFGELNLGADWINNQEMTKNYLMSHDIPRNDLTLFNGFPRYLLEIFSNDATGLISSVTDTPVNLILYGPPGTGKTYELRNVYFPKYTVSTTEVSEVEWINTILEDMKVTWWEVMAVILAQSDKPMSMQEVMNHKVARSRAQIHGGTKNPQDRVSNSLQTHSDLDCPNVRLDKVWRQPPNIFWKDENKKWKLIDDWEDVNHKSERLQEIAQRLHSVPNNDGSLLKKYEFVTFHQSYSYEEFVEGIRPTLGSEADESRELSYELKRGVFLQICDHARNDQSNRYALFIDEINRGNISKIFGELITLLEPDKRTGAINELSVKLPYSGTYFSVPKNLDIYGTMNTADRSLVNIDIALRRRFLFKELTPQPKLLSIVQFDYEDIDLEQMLLVMNQRIEAILDREYMIGHAYFLRGKGKLIDGDELPSIFQDNIIPLLTEYFFNDWSKVRIVLGDDRVGDQEHLQFVVRSEVSTKIVKAKADLQNRFVYKLNHTALHTPDAYVKIYSS